MNAADILRLLIVADVGGVYVDTDYEAVKAMDEAIGHVTAFVSEEEEVRGVEVDSAPHPWGSMAGPAPHPLEPERGPQQVKGRPLVDHSR